MSPNSIDGNRICWEAAAAAALLALAVSASVWFLSRTLVNPTSSKSPVPVTSEKEAIARFRATGISPSEAEAIRVAKDHVASGGSRLSSEWEWKASPHRGGWIVSAELRPPTPGGFFEVTVARDGRVVGVNGGE
jgi:hypothetical protein